MKKKILLILIMLISITNVKALTFNVDLTNIEDKGSNSLGTITNIDITNKELNALFQSSNDEIDFELTITNLGDRAGTLKSITVSSNSNLIDYTTNLPENGLAINGNGTNKVLVNGKLKDGITSGNGQSKLTLKYSYEEGSCPEGEILSEDETMCLCPNGKVRNEKGLCDDEPENGPECKEDEIYNTSKKICEKIEITPPPKEEKQDNPKTGDNILLITLLFALAGLALYAFLFKKFKTSKARRTFGIITAIATVSASALVLITVFGVDGLLGAVINPISKSKEIVVTVNEEVSIIETWNGTDCNLILTPEYIFEGGTGTESDPYKIKTAEQLACFAKSVNSGNTYQGKYIKQISNIKLNDNLVVTAKAGTTTGLNVWTPIGDSYNNRAFAGTFDGNNYSIGGLYLTSSKLNREAAKGLFGYTNNAVLKNINLTDTYVDITSDWPVAAGSLLGLGEYGLIVKNVTTNGETGVNQRYNSLNTCSTSGGVIGKVDLKNTTGSSLLIEDVTNNISPVKIGISGAIRNVPESSETNVILRNVTNNGKFTFKGIGDVSGPYGDILFDNVVNTADNYPSNNTEVWGFFRTVVGSKVVIKNSHNEGNIVSDVAGGAGGFGYAANAKQSVLIDNCYNSGNISIKFNESYLDGLTTDEVVAIYGRNTSDVFGLFKEIDVDDSGESGIVKNSYNTGTLSCYGNVSGLVGSSINENNIISSKFTMDNCYNTGEIRSTRTTGGLVGNTKGTIKNSYNTGNITIWAIDGAYDGAYLETAIGGLVGKGSNTGYDFSGGSIIDSYNEGNILITAKTTNVLAGGICGVCNDITNSRNSGNITSKYAPETFNLIGVRTVTVTNTTSDGQIITENLSY